jgi:hypothetical protein
MNFLAPLFLLGLGAIAVPIVIHLIQRERKEPLEFPSLMFISQVPYKSVRRRRIRNWLLFLMRTAAIILLVLAFARPWLDRELEAVGPLSEAREVVILLDRSYSMAYGDRWERALDAARSAVQGIDPEDMATLVFFDGNAVAVNQRTSEQARLRTPLDTVKPGAGVTRYATALKLAQGILNASDKPRGEVILISDFQAAGWETDESARLPAGSLLTPVNVGTETVSNRSVTGVTVRREIVQGRERAVIAARVTNRSGEAVNDLPVSLEIDGREVQQRTASIAANDAASVEFSALTLTPATVRGVIRVREDELTRDDVFHFAISAGQAVSVLVLEGGGAESSLYIRSALGVGDTRAFQVDTRRVQELRAGDLAGRAVVILNDAPFPGGDIGQRLRVFVERGGGVIVATGERAGANGWGAAADFLPGTPNPPRDRTADGGVVGYLDYGHRVFELFSAPRSGDFTAARFFRYRPITLSSTEGVLARFDDGQPALIERRHGNGRVLVWTSTFDTYWNNLPIQPVFVPFMHEMVRYASGMREPSPWFTVGQVLDPARVVHGEPAAEDTAAAAAQATRPPASTEAWLALTPGGGRVDLEAGAVLRLEEQGFYEVRPRSSDTSPFTVAVNPDLSESDLAAMPPDELIAAVRPLETESARLTASGPVSAEDRERNQRLWYYLLFGAFLLLAGETALSNRLSRRVAR